MKIRNSYKYEGLNLIGQRHGRLTVVAKADEGRSKYICRCDCGNERILYAHKFFTYKSCGCLEKENKANLQEYTRTHGMTETKLYKTWCGIKGRCTNPNTPHYERYGGRGISVCDKWMNSFESFRDWAFSVGYKEDESCKNLSIDRIDPNGNYEPSNCRWVTQLEQARNKEDSRFVIVDGKKVPLEEFSEKNNIPNYFVRRRIDKNQTVEQIIHDWSILHNTPQNLMDFQDALKYYNVCYATLYNWIKSGKIKAEKYGQKWYIPKGQIMIKGCEGRDINGRFIKGYNGQNKCKAE